MLMEAAMVLPILLLILCGALDFGRVFGIETAITSAARAGALVALRDRAQLVGDFKPERLLQAARLDHPELTGMTVAAARRCVTVDAAGQETDIACDAPAVKRRVYVEIRTKAPTSPILPIPGGLLPKSLEGSAVVRIE